MNTSIAVDANPVDGGIGLKRAAPLMAAFTVVGLALLYFALRLCRRPRPHRNHADRYISHHH